MNVNDEVISWTLTDNRPGCTFEIQIDGQPLNELTPERMFETSILDHCQQYQITITPIHSNQGRGTGYTLPFQHGKYSILLDEILFCSLKKIVFLF